MDFDCISSHNKENLRAIAGKTIQADYDHANKILDRWQSLTDAKITIIEGNHEFRMERYINANPQLEGMFEVPRCLHLKSRGINWVPFWSAGKTYKIGNATFIHGPSSLTGFHTKKAAHAYGSSTFYGHTHDVQCFSVEYADKAKTIVGQSLGCLCDKQPYMRGQPDKWQLAFGVFHFFEDGYFQYECIRIFKGRFYYNGKVYQG